MGAVINANIFGELSVILAGMGKDENRFQSLYASANTVMIDLKLKENTC
jgi:predicted membrane-bound mannosyltransferase